MQDVITQVFANPILQTISAALLLAAAALWLAGAWWAYQDASRRTESTFAGFAAAAWVIMSSPLLLPLSLAAYTLARPLLTASDERARALIARLTAEASERPSCPTCALPVDPAWRRCPDCATWFTEACDRCGAWTPIGLELCPCCARDRVSAGPVVAPLPEIAPAFRPSILAPAEHGAAAAGEGAAAG